ncbi:MAG: hypothetical protein JJU37_04005 [Balneolaceae bacterium]|nr:hypothetical protein [Balneolaceae bacterium]
MEHNRQENLTEHIRTVLYDHHEPYVLGSWERFNHHKLKKKKDFRNKYLLRAAAVLLISAAGFFAWFQSGQYASSGLADAFFPVSPEQQPVIIEMPPPVIELPSVFDTVEHPSRTEMVHANTQAMQDKSEEIQIDRTTFSEATNINYQPVTAFRLSESNQFHTLAKAHFPPISAETGTPEMMRHDASSNQTDGELAHTFNSNTTGEDIIRYLPKQPREQFSFGLAYAPLMSIHESQAFPGMSGGISTDWNISDKFSISSGLILAQNQLKYDAGHGTLMQQFEDSDSDQTLATTAGDVNHIRADLLSLEVPLSIRYAITDQFSISAGISSVTFLKEHYDYEFEFEQHIQVFASDGDKRDIPRTEVVRFSETHQQSERSFNSIDWAAFYSFSFGYRFDVSQNHTLSLEPFLKLPNRNFASRDIRYTTGGMQVTLSF